jgi:hypothetical protein
MKELCFEIGRTLLMCVLVEQHLRDALKHWGNPRVNIRNWLDTGRDRRKLQQVIQIFRKRFRIDRAFFNDLDKFRCARNKLAHNAFDIPRQRLDNREGRAEMRAFLTELYQLCKHLNTIFAPALMEHHGRVLGWSQDTIKSYLPPELREYITDGNVMPPRTKPAADERPVSRLKAI